MDSSLRAILKDINGYETIVKARRDLNRLSLRFLILNAAFVTSRHLIHLIKFKTFLLLVIMLVIIIKAKTKYKLKYNLK